MRRITRTLLLTAALLTGGRCGSPLGGDQMLAGASTTDVQQTTNYPAVVMVVLPGGAALCSGTFISPRAVLTAAHCANEIGSYTVYTSWGNFPTSRREVLGPGSVDDPADIAVLVFSGDTADPALGQVIAVGAEPHAGDEIRIVGFGCNDLNTRMGAGTKRTGTNHIALVDDYLELLTTPMEVVRAAQNARAILGPENQAGSCFGDSGGPMLQTQNDTWRVTGVTHAGGQDGSLIASEYINLHRAQNYAFLQQVDSNHGLHLFDGCWASTDAAACGPSSASLKIFGFLQPVMHWILSLFL